VSVYLKSWGDIPASPCDIKGIITAYKITKENINALEPQEGGLIIPKSRYEWRIVNDDQVPMDEHFFVGFLIDYGYGINKKDNSKKDIRKKGTFGFVAEYDPLKQRPFTFPEYWGS
jgi:hypothetical protein